jgi:regulator of replication initiation timing
MNGLNEPKVELPPAPEGMKWEYRGMGWNPGKAVPAYLTIWAEAMAEPAHRRNAVPDGIDDHNYWEAVPAPKTAKQRLETLPDGYRERFDHACDDHLAEENRKLKKKLEVAEQRLSDLKEDWSSRVKQAKNLDRENESLKAELAAYPPLESEWPEKPAPPEGCEWVRQGNEGVSEPGDISLIDRYDDGTLAWDIEDEWGITWEGTIVFRPEKISIVKTLERENRELRIVATAKDIQLALLERDRDYWKGKSEIHEDFAQQAKDTLQKRLSPESRNGMIRDTELDKFVDLIIKAAKQP